MSEFDNLDSEVQNEIDNIKSSWNKSKLFLEQIFLRQNNAEKEISDYISTIKVELTQIITNEGMSMKKTVKKKEDNKKKIVKKEEPTTESSADDLSTSAGTEISTPEYEHSDSTSNDSGTQKKRKRTKKKKSKEDKELSVLEKLLSKLDNRKLHELEPYDEECGVELGEYLRRFEEYYRKNYKGEKYLWLGVLETKLKGRTLQGFKSVRQDDEGYEKVKKKLLRWYEEEKEAREMKVKRNFEKAKMKVSESLSLYSNRLLKLFKMAYPKKDHEKSSILINKFKETVGKKMRNVIDNQIISHKINDKKMTWKKIQKLARIYDVESEVKEDETKESDEDVVVINLSKKDNWQDHDKKEWKTSRTEDQRLWDKSEENRTFYKKRDYQTNNHVQICKYCGRYGHGYDNCRKRLRECFICGKPNHIARDCYKRNDNRQRRYSAPDRNTNYNSYRRGNYSQESRNERDDDRQDLNSKAPEWSRTGWRQ